MAKKPIKVSQATIDKIKKMGMTAALKKAGTSNNAEYVEGIRRMYGARRLSAAKKAVAPAAPSKMSPRVSERVIKKTSPKVAERSVAKKAPAKKATSGYTPSPQIKAKQAMAERGRARLKRGLPQDVVKLGKPKLKLPRLSMGVKQYK